MDISKTHLKQAHLFLNSSILVQIPALLAIMLILLYSEKQLMFLVAPFLLYSLYLFQNYLLNYNRYLTTTKNKKRKGTIITDILSSTQLLIFFAKEESELLLFHPKGKLMGRIKKIKTKRLLPKEFLLVDDNDTPLATYYLSDGSIDVIHYQNGYIGSFAPTKNENRKGVFQLLSGEMIGTLSSSNIFMDDKVENPNKQLVFRLKKGWMSLDSQELFGNPNTPVLSITTSLPESEKLLYLSILIKKFY